MDSKPWHDFVYGKFNFEIMKGRTSFIDNKTNLPAKGNNSGTTIIYFFKNRQKALK